MYAAIKATKKDSSESLTRQRSLRRVLLEDHKANLFGRQNEDLNKIYKVFRREYVILAEYKMIQSETIPGIYVIPARESSLVWFGVIFVRNGPFKNGIFRFNIYLDENFPDSEHPKVVFETEIIHPMIHQDSNELHLLHGFPNWNKNKQHIWQILKYIYWIFNHIDATIDHAINKEIADLHKTNSEAFTEKVNEVVKKSQDHVYDEPPTDDKHYITFTPYDPQIHDQVKESMITEQFDKEKNKGCSWVLPGSFKPLEKASSIEFDTES